MPLGDVLLPGREKPAALPFALCLGFAWFRLDW